MCENDEGEEAWKGAAGQALAEMSPWNYWRCSVHWLEMILEISMPVRDPRVECPKISDGISSR